MIYAKWVATLSDGTTAVQDEGEFVLVPGERRPWVKLVQKLGEKQLHLTSLRLNVDGRTIHLPRLKNHKLGDNYDFLPPENYALEYVVELDDLLGVPEEKHYIILIAVYPNFEVHYIQDLQDINNSWIAVTSGYRPMCETPKLPKVTE